MYVSYSFQQIVQAQMPILPTVRHAEIDHSSAEFGESSERVRREFGESSERVRAECDELYNLAQVL